MSQRRKGQIRRLEDREVQQDKRLTDLEVCVTKIRLEQKRQDRFEDALHAVQRKNAAEDYNARRMAMNRARRAERSAKFWRLATILVLALLTMYAATIFTGDESTADAAVVTTREIQAQCIYIPSPERM